MPLFNTSSSNIDPDINDEIPNDELPKVDGRRRLSFKRNFFTWSTQRQLIDKNKFLFDSNTLISSKGKKSHHNSYIIKTSKYATNYDESDSDYSSDSNNNLNGGENEKKDYHSMEDLNKNKNSKVVHVAQLSESTLCYSSNTNTINTSNTNTLNTVSFEFNQKIKPISSNDINYGFDDNQNNEGIISNIEEESEKSDEESGGENNGECKVDGEIDDETNDEEVNIEKINTIDNIDNIDIINNINSDDEGDADVSDNEEDDGNIKEKDDILYDSQSKYKSTKKGNKKSVTFCDDIVIIEPRRPQKAKNIFKRAISKIIKKKDMENINK